MGSHGVIELDGGAGEGGGQILRTALSLSAVTGRPFAVERVRANRLKPGLRPQHREAARAMAQLCQAEVAGDEVGSARLEFRPARRAAAGEWTFDIGTAGSAPLLLQTLCYPLSLAGGESRLTLRGGTHQDHSPSFHYLALVWAPAVARLGFPVELAMQAAGFYPEGGGEFTAVVKPAHPMPPLDLRHRGTLLDTEVVSLVAGVELAVAERQAERASRRLRDMGVAAQVSCVPAPCRQSRGSHLLVVAAFQRTRSGHGAVSAQGRHPEAIADGAVDAFARFLAGRAAVDLHLGDQLLLPASLAAAGLIAPPAGLVPVTRFTVGAVTKHLTTNADVIRRFLPVEVDVSGREGEEGEVHVRPANASAPVVPLHRG
ncbi:MAG TPA: RNA 3'-terminal phosphate cyclase [Anaeromyxobacteraceae bacterium]|nr:RNA 3'-terminal phosphate cyclase [Anaeromyxobacteraceae bacterium]